ncbi:MAG: MurR/RpiR family transcriptional regulator [Pararhodobacter sp.]|nr:MurR/RpiR family transcriptional regulator [Pararhodobacter sp.]
MTVRELLNQQIAQLTTSERKIAGVLLADYPYAGLLPIQELAASARVSPASATRFVNKLGFAGYQEFQRRLIGELQKRELSPRQLKLTEVPPPEGAPFFHDYAHRMSRTLTALVEAVPEAQVDMVAQLLADPARQIFLRGGRVTDSLARLLSVHLRQIRDKVHHLADDPETWPEALLRMRRQDVVVLFDVRRYDPRLAVLAEQIARERQPVIVLLSDTWLSPIAAQATHAFPLPIDLGTAWDTHVSLVTMIEALIVRVSEADWVATSQRLEAWDRLRGLIDPGTQSANTPPTQTPKRGPPE